MPAAPCDTYLAEATALSHVPARFRLRHFGAVCKGGIHLGSVSLHDTIGASDKLNLEILHAVAGALEDMPTP